MAEVILFVYSTQTDLKGMYGNIQIVPPALLIGCLYITIQCTELTLKFKKYAQSIVLRFQSPRFKCTVTAISLEENL